VTAVWLKSVRCNWFELAGHMRVKGKSRGLKQGTGEDSKGENREDTIFRDLAVWDKENEQTKWRKAHLVRKGKWDVAKGNWKAHWDHVWSWLSKKVWWAG